MADAQFMSIASTVSAINLGLKGQTESYVTALWTNIVSFYFPINKNDANGRGGYMMNHEYYGNIGGQSKCDMVLLHSSVSGGARVYAPLFCLEAKSDSGSLAEARGQLLKAANNILIKSELARPDGRNIQQCWGMVSSGNKFQLYEFDVRGGTDVQLVNPVLGGVDYSGGQEMNLSNVAHRVHLEKFFIAVKYAHEYWFQRTFP